MVSAKSEAKEKARKFLNVCLRSSKIWHKKVSSSLKLKTPIVLHFICIFEMGKNLITGRWGFCSVLLKEIFMQLYTRGYANQMRRAAAVHL